MKHLYEVSRYEVSLGEVSVSTKVKYLGEVSQRSIIEVSQGSISKWSIFEWKYSRTIEEVSHWSISLGSNLWWSISRSIFSGSISMKYLLNEVSLVKYLYEVSMKYL